MPGASCQHVANINQWCGGVSETTEVGAEESFRLSTLSHLFSPIFFCPLLPRGRIDLCAAWTGHRSVDAERSTMLPVTLYAHLCFLEVAARRTNARRSKPARAELAGRGNHGVVVVSCGVRGLDQAYSDHNHASAA